MNQIIVAIIVTAPPTLVALLTLVNSMKNAKAIQDVHISINSRMDQLLKSSNAESKAIGKEEGRKESVVQ